MLWMLTHLRHNGIACPPVSLAQNAVQHRQILYDRLCSTPQSSTLCTLCQGHSCKVHRHKCHCHNVFPAVAAWFAVRWAKHSLAGMEPAVHRDACTRVILPKRRCGSWQSELQRLLAMGLTFLVVCCCCRGLCTQRRGLAQPTLATT